MNIESKRFFQSNTANKHVVVYDCDELLKDFSFVDREDLDLVMDIADMLFLHKGLPHFFCIEIKYSKRYNKYFFLVEFPHLN